MIVFIDDQIYTHDHKYDPQLFININEKQLMPQCVSGIMDISLNGLTNSKRFFEAQNNYNHSNTLLKLKKHPSKSNRMIIEYFFKRF